MKNVNFALAAAYNYCKKLVRLLIEKLTGARWDKKKIEKNSVVIGQ